MPRKCDIIGCMDDGYMGHNSSGLKEWLVQLTMVVFFVQNERERHDYALCECHSSLLQQFVSRAFIKDMYMYIKLLFS